MEPIPVSRPRSGILSSSNSLIYPQELIPVSICAGNCPLGHIPRFIHRMNLPLNLHSEVLGCPGKRGMLGWMQGMFNAGACGLGGSDPQVSLPVE